MEEEEFRTDKDVLGTIGRHYRYMDDDISRKIQTTLSRLPNVDCSSKK